VTRKSIGIILLYRDEMKCWDGLCSVHRKSTVLPVNKQQFSQLHKAPVLKLLKLLKIHPGRYNDKIYDPKKLKILLDFYKICSICNSFQDALAVKISMDMLRGFRVMGFSPNFQRPLAAKLHRTPKRFEVQELARGSLLPCRVWWGSDFTRHRSGQKRVFCLPVIHAFER